MSMFTVSQIRGIVQSSSFTCLHRFSLLLECASVNFALFTARVDRLFGLTQNMLCGTLAPVCDSLGL